MHGPLNVKNETTVFQNFFLVTLKSMKTSLLPILSAQTQWNLC